MPEITLQDLHEGQKQLLDSNKQLLEGQKHLFDGQKQLFEGQDRLFDGQKQLFEGQDRLFEGQKQLFEGQDQLFESQQDILAALHAFATHVDDRFSQVDEKFKSVDQQFTELRATMVTKDYLDNKLADLRGDLVLLARKGNTKLSTLVEQLVAEKRLDPKVAHQILLMEPFPQA